MNITVLSFEFPPEPGGIGEYAYQVANQLTNLGHNILTIVSYQNLSDKDFLDYKKSQQFKIHRIKGFVGRTHYILKKFFVFNKLVKQHNTELVIIVHPILGIIGSLLKFFYKLPYIIIGHGSEFLPINPVHDRIIKFCYNKSNLILPNSRFTISLLEKARIENKNVHLLYPGADDNLYNFSKYKNDHTETVLLTIGSLLVRKGHTFVIDAINILKNRNYKFEYWIVGKGPERSKLEKYLKENKLENYVKLFGYVKKEDLPSFYNKCDLFVLASNDLDIRQVEGFGIVLLEANLMKKPVVGTRNTGMEEIIVDGYNGLLANSKDPEDLANKIEKILSNKKLANKMGENGYNRAKQNFTWSRFGEELNELISQHFSNSNHH